MSRSAAEPAPNPLRSVLVLAALSMVVLLAFAGVRTYRDLATARQRQADLEAEIAGTDQSIEGLERRVRRLTSDPATVERLARERLDMVHPGDVVIVFEEEAPVPTEAPTPR